MMEVADKNIKTYLNMFHIFYNVKEHTNIIRKEMEIVF